jgi:hypothetical protein
MTAPTTQNIRTIVELEQRSRHKRTWSERVSDRISRPMQRLEREHPRPES